MAWWSGHGWHVCLASKRACGVLTHVAIHSFGIVIHISGLQHVCVGTVKPLAHAKCVLGFDNTGSQPALCCWVGPKENGLKLLPGKIKDRLAFCCLACVYRKAAGLLLLQGPAAWIRLCVLHDSGSCHLRLPEIADHVRVARSQRM